MHSRSIQDYVKVIFTLSKPGHLVTTKSIAETLDIKSSSVTEMIGKLDAAGLAKRIKYKGVVLTEEGNRAAIKQVRRHRLWETFLVNELGFGWNEVHQIAEQLEHIESNDLISKLEAYLNFPKFDPHGDPIPDREGNIPVSDNVLLCEAEPGVYAIGRILDDSTELLNYLTRIDISINKKVTVLGREDYDDSYLLDINGKILNISQKVSKKIALRK